MEHRYGMNFEYDDINEAVIGFAFEVYYILIYSIFFRKDRVEFKHFI